ncbi:MAG: hypothetical protein U0R68_08285 [Candidatus Nanopelagicales bacterium]
MGNAVTMPSAARASTIAGSTPSSAKVFGSAAGRAATSGVAWTVWSFSVVLVSFSVLVSVSLRGRGRAPP